MADLELNLPEFKKLISKLDELPQDVYREMGYTILTVSLIVEAAAMLAEAGVTSRIVSFPSWELFETQEAAYRDAVLPPSIKARVAVEAGIAQGWERWVGDRGETVCMTSFGASAPAKVLFEKFGFTAASVVAAAQRVLK